MRNLSTIETIGTSTRKSQPLPQNEKVYYLIKFDDGTYSTMPKTACKSLEDNVVVVGYGGGIYIGKTELQGTLANLEKYMATHDIVNSCNSGSDDDENSIEQLIFILFFF